MSQSNYQRIKKVMQWYYNRGVNSERVNTVYRNIIKQCDYCGLVKGKHKMSCATQKIQINYESNIEI